MLDVSHIADTQSYDIKTYYGLGLVPGTSGLSDWVQWTKPRGIKFIYIFGAGGGGSGGGSDNTSNTSGGGGGGGSGGFTSILLPEMFVPDVLYIYAGAGGKGLLNTIGNGIDGSNTYIAVEPYTTFTANLTLFRANGGGGGGGGTATTAGAAGIGGLAASLSDMPLARGKITTLAGHNGGLGGAANGGNATDITFPVNGLMLTGGAGGGGNASGGTGGNGAGIVAPTGPLGTTYFRSVAGGARAQANNAATPGENGYMAVNFIQNVGGGGGGGGSSGSNRPGAIGGDAAPGCGGGGTGAGSPSNPTIKGGEGGPGFVTILCW